MHLMQVDCSVAYEGRGSTRLPRGVRMLLQKRDGSVQVFSDSGVKPINYMSSSAETAEYVDADGHDHLVFKSKHESLDVTVYSIVFETYLDGFDEPDIKRRGTERQLQAWLADGDNLSSVLDEPVRVIVREYETGKGPVDVLVEDVTGALVLVEVKRVARRADVHQLVRYLEAMDERVEEAEALGLDVIEPATRDGRVVVSLSGVKRIRAVLVAHRFAPGVAAECDSHGVEVARVRGDAWKDGV